MGFFKKNKINPNKKYSMSEALKILNKQGLENYTLLETETGKYQIITVDESRKLETQIILNKINKRANTTNNQIQSNPIRNQQNERNVFCQTINGNGAYKNLTTQTVQKNYNNYQTKRGYIIPKKWDEGRIR